jgi:hypothetical protein
MSDESRALLPDRCARPASCEDRRLRASTRPSPAPVMSGRRDYVAGCGVLAANGRLDSVDPV